MSKCLELIQIHSRCNSEITFSLIMLCYHCCVDEREFETAKLYYDLNFNEVSVLIYLIEQQIEAEYQMIARMYQDEPNNQDINAANPLMVFR